MTPGWDPDRYDDDHAYVADYGGEVLDLLSPAAGERILDLGCGTGHLTAEIAATGADVVGIDRSGEMLMTARTTYPDLPFIQADAQSFGSATSFDAVFSNAALHWMDDPDRVFTAVAKVLRPGGRFVGEFGGEGNVATVVAAVTAELEVRGYDARNPWYFPSVDRFVAELEGHGFDVPEATAFDRPTELGGGPTGLRSWLAMFGGELLTAVDGAERDAVLDAVEDRLRQQLYRDGSWIVDYRRLRFIAIRP